MALGARKDFNEAHAAVDAFAARNPRSRAAISSRVTLLSMQNRVAEIAEELRKVALADPAAMSELSQRAHDAFRSPETTQLLLQVSREGGASERQLELGRLSLAKPEAAAEVTAAYLKLVGMPNPSPDEAMALKRLVVDKFPEWAEARLELGAGLLAGGDIDGAVEQLEHARQQANTLEMHLVPADLLILHGKHEEAPIERDAEPE